MRRFLVSSLLLRTFELVDPSRKSTGWFVVTRRLRAHFPGSEPMREVSVEYDVPPVGESGADAARRADRHRRIEEKAIRALDTVAAAAHRAVKAKQRQQSRAIEAAVADVLTALVCAVCEQACAWEPAVMILIRTVVHANRLNLELFSAS